MDRYLALTLYENVLLEIVREVLLKGTVQASLL